MSSRSSIDVELFLRTWNAAAVGFFFVASAGGAYGLMGVWSRTQFPILEEFR